ncbi:hypothetical protein [Paenibacillus sp. TH7-28]
MTTQKTTAAKVNTRSRKKKVTLDSLIQEAAQLEKLKRVSFEDGRYTEIYVHFSPTRIDQMLSDFAEFTSEYSQKFGELKDNRILDYLHIHILLYFSKLTTQLDFNFEDKVNVLNNILNSDLAEKIFDSFDKAEIQKVYDRMWKKLDAYQELVKTNKDMQQQLYNYINDSNLENKDMIMNVMFGQKSN